MLLRGNKKCQNILAQKGAFYGGVMSGYIFSHVLPHLFQQPF